MERMENDKYAKKVHLGPDSLQKRWINTLKDSLRKIRGLDVRQARRMVQDGVNGWGL